MTGDGNEGDRMFTFGTSSQVEDGYHCNSLMLMMTTMMTMIMTRLGLVKKSFLPMANLPAKSMVMNYRETAIIVKIIGMSRIS